LDYDLEERTTKFAEKCIEFAKSLSSDPKFVHIIAQFTDSSTSIGANYFEANQASSKKDFENKICISRKEANETKYWLRLLAKIYPDRKDDARKLWKETHEFVLIFSKIILSSRNKK
jgi:four helix bundle protein